MLQVPRAVGVPQLCPGGRPAEPDRPDVRCAQRVQLLRAPEHQRPESPGPAEGPGSAEAAGGCPRGSRSLAEGGTGSPDVDELPDENAQKQGLSQVNTDTKSIVHRTY